MPSFRPSWRATSAADLPLVCQCWTAERLNASSYRFRGMVVSWFMVCLFNSHTYPRQVSTKSGQGQVFVSGESGDGAANVGLYRESGGSWSAFRLDFLTKGQTVSVPSVEKWYNAAQNQVKSRPLPRRELPIPISPGIISTGVAASVMGVWLLIIGAHARWLLRLRRSCEKRAPQV